jgi:hypothetical protein
VIRVPLAAGRQRARDALCLGGASLFGEQLVQRAHGHAAGSPSATA